MRRLALFLLLLFVGLSLSGCRDRAGSEMASQPHVMAKTPEEAGRYLVIIGGCNDCHTLGYDQQGTKIPESEWLTGIPLGYRGPWGTTYGSNLRLYVQEVSEDEWVSVARERVVNPPMPWANFRTMAENDLRAIYRYIKSLGPKGEKMPLAVSPGQEPTTPYIAMEPQMPKQGQAPAQP